MVIDGFHSQRASDAGVDVFFDVSLNNLLNKHSIRRWTETPWRSGLRHCNDSTKVYPKGSDGDDGGSGNGLVPSHYQKQWYEFIDKYIIYSQPQYLRIRKLMSWIIHRNIYGRHCRKIR